MGGESLPELVGVAREPVVVYDGCASRLLNRRRASETGRLECRRGQWNSIGSGGMRRYMEEHRWRRRLSGLQLTLRLESMGSEQD